MVFAYQKLIVDLALYADKKYRLMNWRCIIKANIPLDTWVKERNEFFYKPLILLLSYLTFIVSLSNN